MIDVLEIECKARPNLVKKKEKMLQFHKGVLKNG
jgi:hypothetical protein